MDYMMIEVKDNLGNTLEVRKHGNTYAVGYIGDDGETAWKEYDDLTIALYNAESVIDAMARGQMSNESRRKMI